MWIYIAGAVVGVVGILALVIGLACREMRRADEGDQAAAEARRARVDRVFERYYAQRDQRQAGGPSSQCPACGWRHGWDVECGRNA